MKKMKKIKDMIRRFANRHLRFLFDIDDNRDIIWARNEVAYNRDEEKTEDPEGFNYYNECLNSALRAYERACDSLWSDGHSGYSHSITVDILCRLLRGELLSPVDDSHWIPDPMFDHEILNWREGPDLLNVYFNNRKKDLLKYVYKNGSIVYRDLDRVSVCTDGSGDYCWRNGFISNVVDKMVPIRFPYTPEHIYVDTTEYLTDPENGDYDTIHFISYTRKGIKYAVNKYYKEYGNRYVEIDEKEFNDRKLADQRRRDNNESSK